MSKDNFSWKRLFVNDDNAENTEKKENQSAPAPAANSFPKEQVLTSATAANHNPYLDEILAVYEKGFVSLNLENFDFFEMYKSVLSVGIGNAQSYQMAFTMGKTINPILTKEFLLEKSKYYLDEIEKVYINYDAQGKSRRKDLEMEVTRNKVNLAKSISNLEDQIAALQKELDTQKLKLSQIEADNSKDFVEIDLKIQANDLAKNKITLSIQTVVDGINQYL